MRYAANVLQRRQVYGELLVGAGSMLWETVKEVSSNLQEDCHWPCLRGGERQDPLPPLVVSGLKGSYKTEGMQGS